LSRDGNARGVEAAGAKAQPETDRRIARPRSLRGLVGVLTDAASQASGLLGEDHLLALQLAEVLATARRSLAEAAQAAVAAGDLGSARAIAEDGVGAAFDGAVSAVLDQVLAATEKRP